KRSLFFIHFHVRLLLAALALHASHPRRPSDLTSTSQTSPPCTTPPDRSPSRDGRLTPTASRAWMSTSTRAMPPVPTAHPWTGNEDRKSTRLNSSHVANSYAVFCLKKKTENSSV